MGNSEPEWLLLYQILLFMVENTDFPPEHFRLISGAELTDPSDKTPVLFKC